MHERQLNFSNKMSIFEQICVQNKFTFMSCEKCLKSNHLQTLYEKGMVKLFPELKTWVNIYFKIMNQKLYSKVSDF